MEEKTKESPGPGCRNLNIFSSTLKDSLSNIDDLQSLHRLLVVASNELVLELLSFKNYCTISFSDMLKWVGAISFLDAMSCHQCGYVYLQSQSCPNASSKAAER